MFHIGHLIHFAVQKPASGLIMNANRAVTNLGVVAQHFEMMNAACVWRTAGRDMTEPA